jgi:hypothetical protein
LGSEIDLRDLRDEAEQAEIDEAEAEGDSQGEIPA